MSHNLPEPIRDAIEAADTSSPPQIVLRLFQMLDDEPSNYADIARLVEQDPGLCARVLAAANTPAFRRGQPLRNVESCLRALGGRLVRVIATCLAVHCLIDERLTQGIDLAGFWTHSSMVAELSRDIAVMVDYPHPEEAYLAGLLHDVGQLILVSSMREPYLRLLAGCHDEAGLAEQEIQQFGTHHAQIGTALVDSWQLDSPFADGILYHHLSVEEICGATVLPQIVWLAHALTHADEIPGDLLDAAGRMFPELDPPRLRAARQDAERLARQSARTVGIAIDAVASDKLTGLPRLRASQTRDESDPSSQLTSMIGNKALLQTLRQDLFAIEGQEELLLALRESVRLLFGLRRVAFVLHDPLSGELSGKGIAGQAPIFSQAHSFGDAKGSLVALAAVSQQIRSTHDQQPPLYSLKDQQFARAFASAGLLCIPMLSGTRTVGVIVAGISASQHNRMTSRLPALANFGRIAGHCLEDRRQAQSIREQSETSAALRFTRQARRIVHEAGNPLTIIKGYLRLLDGKLPEQADVRHELTVLGEEIERVSSIIQRMSEVPPQETAELALDICDLIRKLLLLYRESLFDGRGIRFEAILPAEPIRVCCDADSVKQILLNLWKNASEALSREQSLTLALTGNLLHQGRPFAELRLEDDGPGMSATALKALHQPPGSERLDGTRGIGLSIVGTLAQRLGIPVTCRSQSGEGTIISLLLPTADDTTQEKRNGGMPGERAPWPPMHDRELQ